MPRDTIKAPAIRGTSSDPRFGKDDITAFVGESSAANNAERALLVIYWLTRVEGVENAMARDIRHELYRIGFDADVPSIAEALLEQDPPVIIEVESSGEARYAVTDAGVGVVGQIMG